MIIKCTNGTETDTDKLPDAHAMVKEKSVELHELCTALKIPYIFRYICDGKTSGCQSFVDSKMDEQETGRLINFVLLETMRGWYPYHNVDIVFSPKEPLAP
jgi:hypothetical protein